MITRLYIGPSSVVYKFDKGIISVLCGYEEQMNEVFYFERIPFFLSTLCF